MKNFDLSNIKIDKKPYKNILIQQMRYLKIKDSKQVKIKSVNPLFFIFNKANAYLEEINKRKYLALVATNESKEKIKKYEELWSKIRNFIRSITTN